MSTLSGGPNIVTDGLVLNLDAANPKSYVSGSTTWRDLSRGGNNGTLTNGPTFNSGNGGSIVFDGVNDYSIVNTPSFNPVGNSSFSISCWIKLNALPLSNPRILSQGVDSNNFFNLSTYGGNSPGSFDSFWFEVKKNGILYGNTFDYSLGNKYTTNIWYNLVGTFNNNTNSALLYINNIPRIGTGINGGGPSPSGPLIIANANISSPSSLNSNISNILIYNRVLNSTEVRQNYNSTKSRFGL
jgi:hypothetical protein